jgi:catechol 2,3-dioxygenase-like lactoylglutathione lyase family enzyme
MITRAYQLTIFVKDQEEAKKFYTEKLGFVVHADVEFAPGWRYLTVAPQRNNESVLELAKAVTPEQQELIGKQAADQVLVMFTTDNIEQDYKDMKARGVVFHGEPQPVPGGRGVGFVDLYGNQLDMFEPVS